MHPWLLFFGGAAAIDFTLQWESKGINKNAWYISAWKDVVCTFGGYAIKAWYCGANLTLPEFRHATQGDRCFGRCEEHQTAFPSVPAEDLHPGHTRPFDQSRLDRFDPGQFGLSSYRGWMYDGQLILTHCHASSITVLAHGDLTHIYLYSLLNWGKNPWFYVTSKCVKIARFPHAPAAHPLLAVYYHTPSR